MSHSGTSHGGLVQYIIGFVLSVILTIIPFWMVMNADTQGFDRTTLLLVIGITAVAQVLIQLIFFLHLNSSQEKRWDSLAFIYTILTIVILVIGSIWIMDYVHNLMMLN